MFPVLPVSSFLCQQKPSARRSARWQHKSINPRMVGPLRLLSPFHPTHISVPIFTRADPGHIPSPNLPFSENVWLKNTQESKDKPLKEKEQRTYLRLKFCGKSYRADWFGLQSPEDFMTVTPILTPTNTAKLQFCSAKFFGYQFLRVTVNR